MIAIKKILVATDFSEGAAAAYPAARKLAETFGGRVDLLHVIPTAKYLHESYKRIGLSVNMSEDIYPKIQKESEERCAEILESMFPDSARGRYDVKIDRKPSEVIVQHAVENGYDMIVIGTRGSHNSRLRGGTAERVIRNSTVPVFCVDRDFNGEKPKTILVPTDLSTISLSALPLAAELAATLGSRLLLYHVMELYGAPEDELHREYMQGEERGTYENLVERVNQFLTDHGHHQIRIERVETDFEDRMIVVRRGKESSVPLDTRIERGISAHYEIARFASENADLVVMATHGHSGLAHFILGSTAEKVIQNVNRPVITIRPVPELLRK